MLKRLGKAVLIFVRFPPGYFSGVHQIGEV
jgi:hypothetical protein